MVYGIRTIIVVFVFLVFNIIVIGHQLAIAQQENQILKFDPNDGPGNGLHIILITGESKYHTEEVMPMLAKILSFNHGFKTTVLFPIDPVTGEVNTNYKYNVPGLENLKDADLMILSTRYQEWPDDQMKHFDEYIQKGKPIIGLRTATHAFRYRKNPDSPYSKYDFRSTVYGWEEGFGKKIFGETWVDHHGEHGYEGTRGLINGIMERDDHPIIRGITDIWVPSDVYGIRELEDDVDVLVWGQSTSGMTPEAPVNWRKSIMPVAWTKKYTSHNGNTGKVFTSTMGASIDMLNEDLRRLLINACYWALEMNDKIPEKNNVDIIGEYIPTMFDF
ncbi:MAG: ThuA domain-containing protein [Balneolaceae bacterium]|nr:ThuA domain-containing protein [Balneolaceae bacterium]